MRPNKIFVLAMIVAADELTGGTKAVVAHATSEIPSILITPDIEEAHAAPA